MLSLSCLLPLNSSIFFVYTSESLDKFLSLWMNFLRLTQFCFNFQALLPGRHDWISVTKAVTGRTRARPTTTINALSVTKVFRKHPRRQVRNPSRRREPPSKARHPQFLPRVHIATGVATNRNRWNITCDTDHYLNELANNSLFYVHITKITHNMFN